MEEAEATYVVESGRALKSEAALRVLRHITGIATKRIFCYGQQKTHFVAIPVMCCRSQSGPSGFSVRLPLHNISCFGFLYGRDGCSIPNLEVENV